MAGAFVTIEEYTERQYQVLGFDDLVTARLSEFSDLIRQEANARLYDIDAHFIAEPNYADVVKTVVCRLTQQSVFSRQNQEATAGTEYEGLQSLATSSTAHGYSESRTVRFQNGADSSTLYIPKNALAQLGLNCPKYGTEVFK